MQSRIHLSTQYIITPINSNIFKVDTKDPEADY